MINKISRPHSITGRASCKDWKTEYEDPINSKFKDLQEPFVLVMQCSETIHKSWYSIGFSVDNSPYHLFIETLRPACLIRHTTKTRIAIHNAFLSSLHLRNKAQVPPDFYRYPCIISEVVPLVLVLLHPLRTFSRVKAIYHGKHGQPFPCDHKFLYTSTKSENNSPLLKGSPLIEDVKAARIAVFAFGDKEGRGTSVQF